MTNKSGGNMLEDTTNYDLIPEHCRSSVRGYVKTGDPLGGFLTAVFSNNLIEAFSRADDINQSRLKDYARFLWNEAPRDCWGSSERVEVWQERGGLLGIEKEVRQAEAE